MLALGQCMLLDALAGSSYLKANHPNLHYHIGEKYKHLEQTLSGIWLVLCEIDTHVFTIIPNWENFDVLGSYYQYNVLPETQESVVL